MSDVLLTHLVDSSDVETDFQFDRRSVTLSAYDEKTRQRYRLTFSGCTRILVTYSDVEDEWSGLNDLTNGITELQAPGKGERRFEIHFWDDSVLEICCHAFSMEPLHLC